MSAFPMMNQSHKIIADQESAVGGRGAPFRSQAPGCCRDDGDGTRVLEFREVSEGLFKPPGLLSFAHYVMTAGSGVLLTRLSIGTSVVDGVMEPRWS